MVNRPIGLLSLLMLLLSCRAALAQLNLAEGDTIDICVGDSYTLEYENGLPDYRYQWYHDGVAMDGDTFATLTVSEAGLYHVVVNTDGNNEIHSDTVTVRLHTLRKPNMPNTSGVICQGRARRFTLTGSPPGVSFQWYRDGVALPDQTDSTLVTDLGGAYQVEQRIGFCAVLSDAFQLRVVEPPVAIIRAADDGVLCHDAVTTLTAEHPEDGAYTYRWSTGETSRSIEVRTAGVYTLTLTNEADCADETSITVEMHDPPQAPHIPDTVICPAERTPVHLSAPAGYAAYEWSGGISRGAEVEISAPGTYTLRVQDGNGCWAATSFVVRQSCAEVTIPNMFSPNGDGINDVWGISGLEYDPQFVVFVVDRNGKEVFRSRGYQTPWDGTFNGRLVPVGAYYYSIRTTTGAQYKGSVTVLY